MILRSPGRGLWTSIFLFGSYKLQEIYKFNAIRLWLMENDFESQSDDEEMSFELEDKETAEEDDE